MIQISFSSSLRVSTSSVGRIISLRLRVLHHLRDAMTRDLITRNIGFWLDN